jgi:hypothetical protein
MPGAFAHMVLVNELRTASAQAWQSHKEALLAVGNFLSFCELGSVGPDYPYMDRFHPAQMKWADHMHYVGTGDMIRAGAKRVRALSGPERLKGLAWLLGYSAHVAMDVVVHPVIAQTFRPYAEDPKTHRLCEMHQDAAVVQRLKVGNLIDLHYMRSSLDTCGAPGDRDKLDPLIARIWREMLAEVYPNEAAATPPDVDGWHKGYRLLVGTLATTGGHGFIGRRILEDAALAYPGTPDPRFTQNLRFIGGTKGSYDQLFERALVDVAGTWADVAEAVLGPTLTTLASIKNWNLDTGRDVVTNRIGYWEAA